MHYNCQQACNPLYKFGLRAGCAELSSLLLVPYHHYNSFNLYTLAEKTV